MNVNESNLPNSDESDDELATVYERPTSEQAKDRLNNADSATLNGWDVTLDDDAELKNDAPSESDSDSLELDEDGLEQARDDIAYVDALLNGEDPDDEGVVTDGGVDIIEGQPEDESHDVERGDEIVVDGVRDSRNPMTVRTVYNCGSIKAIDQFDGIYEVTDGDVSDRVDVVNDDNRTLNDYVDLGGIDKLQLDEDEDESEQIAKKLGLTDVDVDIDINSFHDGYKQIHLFFDGISVTADILSRIEESEFRQTTIHWATKCIVLASPEDQIQEKQLVTDGGEDEQIPQSINPYSPPEGFTRHFEPEEVGGKRYWRCEECETESIDWTREALYSELFHDDDCPRGQL